MMWQYSSECIPISVVKDCHNLRMSCLADVEVGGMTSLGLWFNELVPSATCIMIFTLKKITEKEKLQRNDDKTS